jgi:hypothetical protein
MFAIFLNLSFSLFWQLDLLLFRFIMQQASVGLLPCLLPLMWLPPADLPPNIGQQKEIVQRLLGPKMMKQMGWDTDNAFLIAPRWRHCGEVFCGWGIIFAQCVRLGLASFYYDLDIGGQRHNILTGSGLLFLIQNLLTIVRGGCVWFGIPCSTWVWIARGHTERTKKNINGNTHREDVCQANRMVDIIAMLLDLLVLRGVFYVIEQPSTSLVWFHKELRNHFRSKPKVQRTMLKKHHVWLGYFGHHVFKSTTLVGFFPPLKTIYSRKRKSLLGGKIAWKKTVAKSGPKKGQLRVSGTEDLKATGRCPRKFGRAMAELIRSTFASKYSRP